MTGDGKLHPCYDKAKLIHQLENQVEVVDGADDTAHDLDNDRMALPSTQRPDTTVPEHICLLLDTMTVVNEQAGFKGNINNCKDLTNHLVCATDSKFHEYVCSYVVSDNFNVTSSLNDNTKKRRTGGKSSYVVNYKIRDFATFLSSTKTKYLLTLYLAEQLREHCTSPVSTVTHLSVLSNQPVTHVVDLRSTLLILYGSEIHKDGSNIHIYASDTDVFVLAPAMT